MPTLDEHELAAGAAVAAVQRLVSQGAVASDPVLLAAAAGARAALTRLDVAVEGTARGGGPDLAALRGQVAALRSSLRSALAAASRTPPAPPAHTHRRPNKSPALQHVAGPPRSLDSVLVVARLRRGV